MALFSKTSNSMKPTNSPHRVTRPVARAGSQVPTLSAGQQVAARPSLQGLLDTQSGRASNPFQGGPIPSGSAWKGQPAGHPARGRAQNTAGGRGSQPVGKSFGSPR